MEKEQHDAAVDRWMRALAASPSPSPKLPTTPALVRRARLERRLACERNDARRALGPAILGEAFGLAAVGALGVYLCGAAGFGVSGLGGVGGAMTFLGVIVLVLWVLVDEPAFGR
ncbi:MAG: hypothetical protein KC486_17475 [Myxococcales bacterium]|nr:hypothetical protein [Myxococcales bacterium]